MNKRKTTHEASENGNQTTKRVRVSRACDQCRAGREKCDVSLKSKSLWRDKEIAIRDLTRSQRECRPCLPHIAAADLKHYAVMNGGLTEGTGSPTDLSYLRDAKETMFVRRAAEEARHTAQLYPHAGTQPIMAIPHHTGRRESTGESPG